MWLVELIALSAVAGVILGFGLHAWDNWRARVEARKLAAKID